MAPALLRSTDEELNAHLANTLAVNHNSREQRQSTERLLTELARRAALHPVDRLAEAQQRHAARNKKPPTLFPRTTPELLPGRGQPGTVVVPTPARRPQETAQAAGQRIQPSDKHSHRNRGFGLAP